MTTRPAKPGTGTRGRGQSGKFLTSFLGRVFGSCRRRTVGLVTAHGGWNKPIERLVPVSFTRYRASTPGLSTWWSPTALKGELVLRQASRLDAFSGYPFRT